MIKFKHFVEQFCEQAETFRNELGNKITVNVYKKDIDAVDGIMIKISGPHSETEDHITYQEAEKIYLQLKKIFE